MTLPSKLLHAGATLLLVASAACGGSSNTPTPPASSGAPTVLSNTPANGATGVSQSGSISVTFSEAMDPATLTTTTFTLTSGNAAAPVAGSVTYANSKAVFVPAAPLATGGSFTATISTGARSASGDALTVMRTWTFATGAPSAAGIPVSLGAAGGYAILAKSGISTVPPSVITGDIGVSPAAATAITGFAMTADAGHTSWSTSQVTGRAFAADCMPPTPANLTAAVSDMEHAFTDAAGRAAGVTELGAGNIGGMNLAPGVYKWGTGLLIPADVTLTGSAADVWIFQVAGTLALGNGAKVLLAGGALPKNVFWQVAGAVTLGTTAHLEGVVLTQTMAALHTGASVNGRLLAQTAVTLDASTVVEPAP